MAREQMIRAGLVAGPEIDGFAVGDRVIFGSGSRAAENGVMGTVQKIIFTTNNAELIIRTDDGRNLAADAEAREKLSHGYAVSVHKSQGMTIDKSYVFIDDLMIDKELGYVAGSRHREKCEFFCDEETAEDLKKLLSRSRQKETSLDYEIEQDQEQEQEIEEFFKQPDQEGINENENEDESEMSY